MHASCSSSSGENIVFDTSAHFTVHVCKLDVRTTSCSLALVTTCATAYSRRPMLTLTKNQPYWINCGVLQQAASDLERAKQLSARWCYAMCDWMGELRRKTRCGRRCGLRYKLRRKHKRR